MEMSFEVMAARQRSNNAESKAFRTSGERASKNNWRGIPRQNFPGPARRAEGLARFGSRPTREYKTPVRGATSPTVRASGPAQSKAGESGMMPSQEMRPQLGFRPATPQRDAGMRMEPPVSVPMLPWQRPAATAAAEPPLEPPGMRVGSQGFRTGPKWGLLDVTP